MDHNIDDILEFNYLLHATSRMARKLSNHYLSEMGCPLEQAQMDTLRYIEATKNDKNLSMTHVAREMSLDRTTLSRNAKVLIKKGFLSTAYARNRRTRAYVLTEKGMKCLKDNQVHVDAASQIIYELSSLPKSIKEMRELLIELTD